MHKNTYSFCSRQGIEFIIIIIIIIIIIHHRIFSGSSPLERMASRSTQTSDFRLQHIEIACFDLCTLISVRTPYVLYSYPIVLLHLSVSKSYLYYFNDDVQ
jgi:hypothetical protein